MDDDEVRLSSPARWHRTLAKITGELAMCIGRRKLSRVSMVEWINRLREVADEMERGL